MDVHIGVVATAFAVIGLAELPDKTMIACLIMATRSKPLPVWVGAAAAWLVHVVLAVAAGGALSLLPHEVVEGIAAAAFAGAGLWLLRSQPPVEEESETVEEELGTAPPRTAVAAMGRAFVVIFLSEWGDVTQIATANLAARYDAPFSVGLGAELGLMTAGALAVTAGRLLLRVVPLVVVRRVAGVLLILLALATVVQAVR
jgi:putative Ca2+/H+ antiporter (TMEM165/GDT1 family)